MLPKGMQVQLVGGSGGKVVGRYMLEAGEVALTARAVHLADRNNGDRTRPLIAVGTSFTAGTLASFSAYFHICITNTHRLLRCSGACARFMALVR